MLKPTGQRKREVCSTAYVGPCTSGRPPMPLSEVQSVLQTSPQLLRGEGSLTACERPVGEVPGTCRSPASSLWLVFCLCRWRLTFPSPLSSFTCVFVACVLNVPLLMSLKLGVACQPTHLPVLHWGRAGVPWRSTRTCATKFNLFLQWTYWIYSFVQSCTIFF